MEQINSPAIFVFLISPFCLEVQNTHEFTAFRKRKVGKGTRRPPDGWPSRPLHFSLSPLHPPVGEFPTTRPPRARDHASPGRVCHVPCCGEQGSRHRLTALSRPLHSAFSTSVDAIRQRIAIGSPNGHRSAHSDHPLTFPLKGDPPPAL